MPYVPSEKTDGKSQDRNLIDAEVEALANAVASRVTNNMSVVPVYEKAFMNVAVSLKGLLGGGNAGETPEDGLAQVIYDLGESYGYEGAYLGEFNYAITRFIQRVPQIKVANDEWASEIRYWLYAATVDALLAAAADSRTLGIGLNGVFMDIKDEYKRRVNHAYEVAQIVKSGDCYDTPYYTRAAEVVDDEGNLVGHVEIMLERSDSTLDKDILDGQLVLTVKK